MKIKEKYDMIILRWRSMTIVFKVSDNVKQKMIKYYEPMKCEKTPPYAIFQVKDFDCVTTLYESGKVMFQGIGADIEASIWIEQERILNNRVINPNPEKKEKKVNQGGFIDANTIGSDEVGTGDFFGPIVVCASYVEKKQRDFLVNLGVRDSKKLTDKQIIDIAPTIIKNIPNKAIVLNNETYNQNYSESVNMNKIKAILHNKVLLGMIGNSDYKYEKIVVDQFTPAKNYYGYLSEVRSKVTGITFMTKAEDQVLSVACSSIIARYYFLREMKKMSDEYKVTFPLGAGNNVDEIGVNLVKQYGEGILYKVSKLNFKNVDKIKELMRSSK